ncbi:MAG: glutaminase [Pseudomonadota bacterium]
MERELIEIAEAVRPLARQGKVAQYIPALARVDPEAFALVLITADGKTYTVGAADQPFSIQSISKLFALSLAMELVGDPLWQKVGREPSGMRFNSLIQLETDKGPPRNPFINAGAIAVTDALLSTTSDYPGALVDELRHLSGAPEIAIDPEVHASEIRTGDLNRAMAYVLRAHKVLENDPVAVTEAYFGACAIAMSAIQLTRAAMFLVTPQQGSARCAEGRHAQRIRAIMRTCGLYDQSGEFAFHVGLPGKSGVGGGVLVVQPDAFAACAWSPPLDRYGNSVAGQAALQHLARLVC